MRTMTLALSLTLLGLSLSGCGSPPKGAAELCTSTGGSAATTRCCTSASDYPGTCAVGACGCAPASSHDVTTCACPSGKCFDPTAGCK